MKIITTQSLAFVLLAAGCASSPSEHLVPSARLTPHLRPAATAVACGDDVALYGSATPDIRYGFTYDAAGQLSHADGVYAAGGSDDAIDYSYDAQGSLTHLLESRAWGDTRVELTAAYDGAENLTDYNYALSQANWSDAWQYAMSSFVGPDQPTREVISETGQPDLGYTLSYDATGRLVEAVPDSGAPTTWTYDDTARTIAIDTGNGAFHGTIQYDDQDRELSETWGGTDPSAIASATTYAWSGDRLDTMTYQSGTSDAPTQLSTVEVDTLRYDCAAARAGAGRTVHFVRPGAAR